jgi:DNA-binding transcriptional LysR family regulator
MIAMRLTWPFKAVLVASPKYLEAKGAPKTIGDLHQPNCIGLRMTGSGGIFDWELMDGKKIRTMKTSGTALVTDSSHAAGLASAGVGIAYAVEPLVRRQIQEGRLRWLLPQCAVAYDGLFLYHPQRASLAPKLRVFIEAAKAVLRS